MNRRQNRRDSNDLASDDELKTMRGQAVRLVRDWKAKQKVWPQDAPSKTGKPAGFPPKTNTASGYKPRAGYLTSALGSSSQAGKMDPPPAPGGKRGRKPERERDHRSRLDYSGGSSSGTEPPAKTIGIQRSSIKSLWHSGSPKTRRGSPGKENMMNVTRVWLTRIQVRREIPTQIWSSSKTTSPQGTPT